LHVVTPTQTPDGAGHVAPLDGTRRVVRLVRVAWQPVTRVEESFFSGGCSPRLAPTGPRSPTAGRRRFLARCFSRVGATFLSSRGVGDDAPPSTWRAEAASERAARVPCSLPSLGTADAASAWSSVDLGGHRRKATKAAAPDDGASRPDAHGGAAHAAALAMRCRPAGSLFRLHGQVEQLGRTLQHRGDAARDGRRSSVVR
jgi:hypothetical protein